MQDWFFMLGLNFTLVSLVMCVPASCADAVRYWCADAAEWKACLSLGCKGEQLRTPPQMCIPLLLLTFLWNINSKGSGDLWIGRLSPEGGLDSRLTWARQHSRSYPKTYHPLWSYSRRGLRFKNPAADRHFPEVWKWLQEYDINEQCAVFFRTYFLYNEQATTQPVFANKAGRSC